MPALNRDLSAVSRRAVLAGLAYLPLASVSGCFYPSRGDAVPGGLTERVDSVRGITGTRYVTQSDMERLSQDVAEAVARERTELAASGHRGPLPPSNLLAISGGGEDGAFGAGLLCGWSETGTRPEFRLVTGVSTGALSAPFAFLGPRYDRELREVYTTITARDVLVRRGLTAALFDDAMADTTPLRRFVARYATERMMEDIAREHERGRLLLVATTNIDARRGVIWNVGKLAASGAPGALDLFREILVASAAIPGAFPPVMLDVTVEGRTYQEMHVDGGATAQAFAYPAALISAEPSFSLRRLPPRTRHLFVIRNARLDADADHTNRRTLDIVGRAITSLIHTQGIGDLYRMYALSRRDGVDFNLAFIPPEFDMPYREPFEPAYMNALFRLGYDLGRAGYRWNKTPPGYA